MPLFLDLHKIQSKAKETDNLVPEETRLKDNDGCRCLSSWFDLQSNNLVSLLDAPGETTLKKQLDLSHGIGSYEILPVNSKVAEVFLERLQQNQFKTGNLRARFENLKTEKAVRVLLIINTADPYLLRFQLGARDFFCFHEKYQNIIQNLLVQLQARIIHRQRNFCVASFLSVYNALTCAVKIKKSLIPHLNAAEVELILVPGKKNSEMPDPLSEYHFHSATKSDIVVASQIRKMCGASVEKFRENEPDLYWLSISEERHLKFLLQVLNQNWQNPNFNCREFGRKTSMSKSSLYRRCTAVTGRSPNSLIKEYRLLKALRLLESGQSITKTCYDIGFNSPSYFCHCFHQQFKIQPGFYKRLCEA